ncbi:MAG: tRNA uridine-5-carboxymethylaminomethyl(34) synthesis GTPase MnmE [Deltaproteobacteria bacterium]|nr:tRNA uridine-5-carboxymethylaminomethyl(34) synthesis GTPase MnmE [Deltaproteobacteria bacterium]
MQEGEETIAAIATPVGQAGIGIVRLSGPRSLSITSKIFRPRKGRGPLRSHRLYLGELVDPATAEPLDEVLVSYMKAPRSYTREDVVEINCHSGYVLLSKILELLLSLGARPARPGEFTLRIDLSQAEAVVDLINAKSEKGLALASQQIRGAFRDRIADLKAPVLDLLARLEAAIDYPEEAEEILDMDEITDIIQRQVIAPINVWVDGVQTVIVGRVNAGKSSLLNRLLNEERAIVTPVAGTTRDVIESTVTLEGLPLRLLDTAGLRRAKDQVEELGLELARRKMEEADLVLVVVDQSRPLGPEDRETIRRCKGKETIVVLNKIDLPCGLDPAEEGEVFGDLCRVRISALTGEGIPLLARAIREQVLGGETDLTTSQVVPNLRHREALGEALRNFEGALESLRGGRPLEIAAFELRAGLDALGAIVGETTDADLLDRIFSRFCLGK